MGKEFTSASELFRVVAGDVKAIIRSSEPAMRAVGQFVKIEAQAKMGEYQPAVGPYAPWAPLTDGTKQDRAQRGYTDDEPLLRTGALRDAITYDATPIEAKIGVKGGVPLQYGSHDLGDLAVWQELGTATIPPRAFLAPALFENRDEVVKIIAEHVAENLQRKL